MKWEVTPWDTIAKTRPPLGGLAPTKLSKKSYFLVKSKAVSNI